jgi:hypothetical protein
MEVLQRLCVILQVFTDPMPSTDASKIMIVRIT